MNDAVGEQEVTDEEVGADADKEIVHVGVDADEELVPGLDEVGVADGTANEEVGTIGYGS